MKLLTYLGFNKELSLGKLSCVYFISGEEPYQTDECLRKIEKLVDADSLNREVFHAPEVTSSDIVNAVETLPFLCERRLVIIKNVDKLKNEEYETVKKLIENPVSTTCLVLHFVGQAKKIGKRKDLVALCEDSENVTCVECKKVYDKDVSVFIQNEFKNRGKIISYELVRQMVNESGTNLLNVINEIEKICVYTGDKKEVTTEDFSKISGFTKEINAFMLSEVIEQKDLKKSLFIFEKMIENGEEPIVLLFTIAGTVRKLLTVKSMIEEKKLSQKEALDSAKMPNYPFIRQRFMSGLDKYKLSHLKASLKELLKADIAIKTGKTTSQAAVEELIMFVCK